jgi:predicted nucleotidyltransferase
MEAATERLRGIARRMVEEAQARGPLRAALLAGSAGRGDADEWSDVDLILYVDEVPAEQRVERRVDGVRVEVTTFSVAWIEERLQALLVDLEPVGQHGATGMVEGLVLHDDGVLEGWRERLRAFPEPLRRALVERNLRDLFAVWEQQEKIDARDAELWRIELLLDGAFRILGALAALNRLYFDRSELKRMRRLTDAFTLAPPALAERLESLFRLPPADAAEELRRLVSETRALVAAELDEELGV